MHLRKTKALAFLLAALIALVSLAACGGGTTPSSAAGASQPAASGQPDGEQPKQPVTVSWFTETSDEAGIANFQKFYLDPLAEALPHITIDWRPTADWDATLKIELAAGKGADLLTMDGPVVAAEYVAADRLMDLTPYAEQYGWNDIIYDWAYDVCKVDGKLMSIPNGLEGLVMFYRTDIFEENEWAMPTGADAFDALLADEKAAGYIPMAFGTAGNTAPNEHWVSAALNSYAGPNKVRDALQGRAKWTDPELRDAFQKLVDMWQAGYLSESNSQSISNLDASALLAQGRAAMTMNGTWCFWVYSTFYPEMPWDVTPIPNLKDDAAAPVIPLALSGVWAVNKNAAPEAADACAEILNFLLTSPQLNIQGIEEADYNPLPIGLDGTMFSDKIDAKKLEMYDMLFDAQAEGNYGYCTWTFWPPQTRNYLMDSLDGVFLGETSLDDYLSEMQRIFDGEFEAGAVPAF